MDVRTHGTCLRTNPKETPRHFKRFAGVFFQGIACWLFGRLLLLLFCPERSEKLAHIKDAADFFVAVAVEIPRDRAVYI